MLNPTHKLWLTNTLRDPLGWAGGAALTALQLDYLTPEEWEEIKRLRGTQAWGDVRQTLACFVLLAEGHDLEV